MSESHDGGPAALNGKPTFRLSVIRNIRSCFCTSECNHLLNRVHLHARTMNHHVRNTTDRVVTHTGREVDEEKSNGGTDGLRSCI